jgi:hypothetical protein
MATMVLHELITLWHLMALHATLLHSRLEAFFLLTFDFCAVVLRVVTLID